MALRIVRRAVRSGHRRGRINDLFLPWVSLDKGGFIFGGGGGRLECYPRVKSPYAAQLGSIEGCMLLTAQRLFGY